MNAMLSDEVKGQGTRYVFAIGSMSNMIKQRAKKNKKREQQQPSSIFQITCSKTTEKYLLALSS